MPQFLRQIDEGQRPHFRGLLVVGGGGMAAIGVFVEQNLMALGVASLAAILRACTGVTRSLVAVTKNTGG